MLPPGLKSPREAVLHHDEVYYDLINSGKAHPFLYPWAGLAAAVVFAFLLIDHRRSAALKWCRFPVFAFFCAYQTWCTITNRARNPAASLGVGLLSCWGMMWVAAVMIWNDCQTDFTRIERRDDVMEKQAIDSQTSGTTSQSNGFISKDDSNPRQQQTPTMKSKDDQPSKKGPNQRTGPLFWQSYPSGPFIERVDWIADVFCSFRGVGWNWQTSGVPKPPHWVEAQLDGNVEAEEKVEPFTISKTGVRRYSDRALLIKKSVQSWLTAYVILDGAATLMHKDPYFWGYVDSRAPSYLPTLIQDSFVLTRCYRLLLSLSGIYFALWYIFKMGPVFFCGVLGPRWIGVRGEAWMNPADMFGSFDMVLDKSLTGWWGGWWHQTFRFAFEAPTTWLMKGLNVDKRSPQGKALGLVIAFVMSGCIHACGSYTMLGETRPLQGPMCFFLLQGVGILAQTLMVGGLSKAGIPQKLPKVVLQATNVVVVAVWMYLTAPLLADDFARGGVWLFEPVPFSPLRGLGLGAPDDQFFCLWNKPVSWRTGKHWWDTGIAL